MTVKEHYKAGRLSEALASATQEVKQNPSDVTKRRLLCEMLCFAGDLDRADVQLDAIAQMDSTTALDVSLFRQLLRGEQARRQFYDEGRVPEFLDTPTANLQIRLQASIALRDGRPDEAAKLLGQAELERARIAGVCNGEPFDDFRDMDDLTASFFEVLTSNGKYYWVPFEKVDVIEFEAAQRPRDLLWRAAHLVVHGGPDGQVFVPVLYAGSHANDDELVRLGRITDWRQTAGPIVRGCGQRSFLVGDGDRSILELTKIEFQQSSTT
ncbi:MAG: hypothetical protein L0Y44_02405 [Phycisphaerales bacterium]|nr:hypothetical protein [Phycisphaerales bacterium]MCI0629487.1 hypothetical protein [Phycisphaerales bacterium]MCI0674743.1 hypothetical protein [Phycisphaerales bacterium]